MDLTETEWREWTGYIWLTIATSVRLLWTRHWNFGFHKRRWICLPGEWLFAYV